MALRRRTREHRSTVYKVCSLLLSYPDGELLSARDLLTGAVAELPACPARESLERFCAWWRGSDSLALEQGYVATFDLDKRCGLYLTFYGEGDRRDRGMALLRLRQLYRAAGFPQEGRELPDFLPVMLEFASCAHGGRGELVLREHRAALELVRLSLREQHSPYAHVLDAVCEQVGALSAGERLGLDRLIAQGPPQELVGLEPFTPPEVMPSTGARR